jgi:hypothetical protein
VQPNPVQGNPISHPRSAQGVGYAGLPYFYDPLAYMDTNPQENMTPQQAPAQRARPEYVPQQEPPAAQPAYSPEAHAMPAPRTTAEENAAADDGLDHPEVTLVFKDGRAPLKVHSYVLTGSSVFVAEHGHQRVIPVSELDLAATIAQNREAGVDFALPGRGK